MIKRTIYLESIATQKEVARELGITQQTVSETETRAIAKLKKLAASRGIDLTVIIEDNLIDYRLAKMNSPNRCNECQYCGKDSCSNYCAVSSLRLRNAEVESIRPTWCKLAFKQKVMFKKSKLIEA